MEESSVKKEIVVKRMSAFKFKVEVFTKEENSSGGRVSVIKKAPPASSPVPQIPSPPVPPPPSDTIPTRQVIMQRIMQILLWKLLGEERLKCCGYPNAPSCVLLRRVVQLSKMNQKPLVEPSVSCDGSMACFTEQVKIFLNICAPNEEYWVRFGWKGLSEEAILRKIYQEMLSPNLYVNGIESDQYVYNLLKELKLLCQLEREGCTSIAKQHSEKNLQRLIRSSPTKMYPRLSLIEERRLGAVRGDYSPHNLHEWRSSSEAWIRQPRPHRISIPEYKIMRIGQSLPAFRIHPRPHPTPRSQR